MPSRFTIYFNSYYMMASPWQFDYYQLILQNFKVNSLICLLLEMNLSPVLSREEGSAFTIVTFSRSHNPHFRVQPL